MAVTPLYIDKLAAKDTLSDKDLVIVGEGDDAKKMTIAQLKDQLGINALNTKTTLKIVDKSIAFNGGSFNLHLSRDGSIVTASTSGVINIPEANTIYTFGQVIPEGFRPIAGCGTAVALVSSQTQSGIMRLMVDENGVMSGVSSVNQSREIYGSISWATNDLYPS